MVNPFEPSASSLLWILDCPKNNPPQRVYVANFSLHRWLLRGFHVTKYVFFLRIQCTELCTNQKSHCRLFSHNSSMAPLISWRQIWLISYVCICHIMKELSIFILLFEPKTSRLCLHKISSILEILSSSQQQLVIIEASFFCDNIKSLNIIEDIGLVAFQINKGDLVPFLQLSF